MTAGYRVGFLDELRGFAALYVAAAHVLIHHLELGPGWARLPWLFGQEMVMVFFLISGAAIRLSMRSRVDSGSVDFLRRRFQRLFPMIVLGLAVGYFAVTIEAMAWQPVRWLELLGNLFFLQDFSPVKPGTICSTYYGNAMLWSLSYEWWFYVIFLLIFSKISKVYHTHSAGLISLLGVVSLIVWPNGPSYWATYFIIWWAGGTLVDPERKERLNALRWLVATSLVILFFVIKTVGSLDGRVSAGVYPLLVARHLGFSAGLLGLLVVAGPGLRRLADRRLRGFAWAAPVSYALYVVHYPLAADSRWLAATGLPAGLVSAIVYGSIALAVAWLAEKFYQPWALRLIQSIPKLKSSR